jgi:hypothetical protein
MSDQIRGALAELIAAWDANAAATGLQVDGAQRRYTNAWAAARAALAAAPAQEPHKPLSWERHCQNGGDLCRAGFFDGVCCPEESCDIDDGTRTDPERAQPAPAEDDAPVAWLYESEGEKLACHLRYAGGPPIIGWTETPLAPAARLAALREERDALAQHYEGAVRQARGYLDRAERAEAINNEVDSDNRAVVENYERALAEAQRVIAWLYGYDVPAEYAFRPRDESKGDGAYYWRSLARMNFPAAIDAAIAARSGGKT